MPVEQPLAVKFLRYFDAPSHTQSGAAFGMWLRVLYEFWGFCVNGTDDLKHPGGFPTGSTSDTHMSGVINMPAGWESGSILFYSNSDGITNDGMPYFTGSNFTSAMVGKWLTVWKSGSICTDDSIYLITKLYGPPGTTTSSIIGVDNNMGCTPYPGSLKPAFTERTNVNYRVIDFSYANVAYNTYHHIVLQMNGAPYVNLGQANSQVKLRLATMRGDSYPRGIAIQLLPSGTWAGTGSTDGLSGGNSKQGSSLTDVGEFGPNSGNSDDWHNAGAGTQCINLIAAQDFFTLTGKGDFASSLCGIHVEIPQRLYPYEYDPNPMTAMGLDYGIYAWWYDPRAGYGNGFYMIANDNKPYWHWAAIRCNGGDQYHYGVNAIYGYSNGYYNNAWFNPIINKFFLTDGVLGTNAPPDGHYLARARLRRVRFIPPIIPTMQRLGDNGEWVHVANGICWPWDNALLPSSMFKRGY